MASIVLLTTPTEGHTLLRYLGPYQIAWWLRENDFQVQVLDFLYFMTSEQRAMLYKKFINEDTKIIAFAPFVTDHRHKFELGLQTLIDIIVEAKEYAPSAKIVIGGVYANEFIRVGHTDYPIKIDGVFYGESEHTFLDYANYVLNKQPHPAFELTNNLKVFKPHVVYEIHKCNMHFHKNDCILPNESLPLEMSRGCIFTCKFCRFGNLGKDKDDFNKSINSIKESLIYNYEQFGTTKYNISDDTLNSHRTRTVEFHKMTKELPFKIEYIGYVRMDLLDIWPEQQEILPESGLVSCHFGIESFSPVSCKQIGKGWGATKNKPFLSYIIDKWKKDVLMRCTMIAGLGNETKNDWQSSYDWLAESGIHDWKFNPLEIIRNNPGSIFDAEAEQYGYKFRQDQHGNEVWYNDYTTHEEATEWCKDVEFLYMDRRKPTAWMYMAYTNVGFAKEEIFTGNYVTLSRQRKQKGNIIVDNYFSLVMSHVPVD